jgi:hypothetical protein
VTSNFSLNSFLADSRKSVPSLRSTHAWKVLFLYVQLKSNGRDFHRTRLSVPIFFYSISRTSMFQSTKPR